MVGKSMNPVRWLAERLPRVPRNGAEAEKTAMSLLKLVFWALLLAPVIIIPVYYLLVVAGLAPPIHLPPG